MKDIFFKYTLFSGLILFPLLTLALVRDVNPPVRDGGGQQEKCLECHEEIGNLKKKHAALEGGCETCHQPEGGDHPNEGGFVLPEKVPALCFMCHEEFLKKDIHPPVKEGECLSCHDPHGTDNSYLLLEPEEKICLQCHDGEVPEGYKAHYEDFSTSCNNCHDPHQSDHASLLTEAPPQLCFQCHENETEGGSRESVHYPYTEESCTLCHNPHKSKNPSLLTEKMPDLCYNCHDRTVSSSPHLPVEEGKCMACHTPHTSGRPALLKEDNKTLCLGCHDRVYEHDSSHVANIADLLTKKEVVHGAMEMDGCLTCHDGHGTGQSDLLKNKYPSGDYVRADAAAFALCFDCHDAAILEQDPAASGTGFRDGKKNLHYVHVHGDHARNCSMCHNVHAAGNSHLIREELKYGQWTMKMNYRMTDNGGSCRPGCHGDLSYDRNKKQ